MASKSTYEMSASQIETQQNISKHPLPDIAQGDPQHDSEKITEEPIPINHEE